MLPAYNPVKKTFVFVSFKKQNKKTPLFYLTQSVGFFPSSSHSTFKLL